MTLGWPSIGAPDRLRRAFYSEKAIHHRAMPWKPKYFVLPLGVIGKPRQRIELGVKARAKLDLGVRVSLCECRVSRPLSQYHFVSRRPQIPQSPLFHQIRTVCKCHDTGTELWPIKMAIVCEDRALCGEKPTVDQARQPRRGSNEPRASIQADRSWPAVTARVLQPQTSF